MYIFIIPATVLPRPITANANSGHGETAPRRSMAGAAPVSPIKALVDSVVVSCLTGSASCIPRSHRRNYYTKVRVQCSRIYVLKELLIIVNTYITHILFQIYKILFSCIVFSQTSKYKLKAIIRLRLLSMKIKILEVYFLPKS